MILCCYIELEQIACAVQKVYLAEIDFLRETHIINCMTSLKKLKVGTPFDSQFISKNIKLIETCLLR